MIKNIVFDWSGTLSDDFEMSYHTVMSLFHELDIPTVSFARFQEVVEIPYQHYIPKLFAEHPEYLKRYNDAVLDDDVFKKHFEKFGTPRLLPGAEKAVTQLQAQGFNMALFSSHHQGLITKEANSHFGLKPFSHIIGNAGDKLKSYPGMLEKTGFKPEETLYVGDTTHDIEVGKAAGMKTAAVLSGYHIREDLQTVNPDVIINSVSDLASALRSAPLQSLNL